ncbi:hypothetical protein OROGR_033213 [Orobanche gracilis]
MCENYTGSYYNATYVGLKAMGRSCIAAFRFYMNDKFLVWTSKDPEKQENKWEKLITLSLSSPELKFTCSIRPLWFTMDGKVLLIIGLRGDEDQHQHNFGVYDPQKKSLEFVQIYGMEITSCVMLTMEMEYIPSLVSPNMFDSGMRQVIDTNMRLDIGAKKRKRACPSSSSWHNYLSICADMWSCTINLFGFCYLGLDSGWRTFRSKNIQENLFMHIVFKLMVF